MAGTQAEKQKAERKWKAAHKACDDASWEWFDQSCGQRTLIRADLVGLLLGRYSQSQVVAWIVHTAHVDIAKAVYWIARATNHYQARLDSR